MQQGEFDHEYLPYTTMPVYKDEHGMFQPGPPRDVLRRRANIAGFVEGWALTDEIPISIYQEWAELDWVQPHHTYLAVNRFAEKISEEAGSEAPQTINLEKVANVAEPSDLESKQIVDELGDVLFCTSALASCVGVNLERAIAHYLVDEVGHTKIVIKAGDLDQLIASGWRPRFTPADDREEYDLFTDFDELNPRDCLFGMYSYISTIPRQIYHYGEQIMVGKVHDMYADVTYGQEFAKMTVFLAYFAKRWANKNFSDVVQSNVIKITARAQQGKIDNH